MLKISKVIHRFHHKNCVYYIAGATQESASWVTKGLAHFDLNKYDESIKAFEKAIEIDPQNTDAWIYKYDYQAA